MIFVFHDSSTFFYFTKQLSGPITVVEEDGKTYIVGMTSIGYPGYPDAGDRVSSYLAWIKCQAFNNSCLSSLEYDFPENYLYTRAPTQALSHGAVDDPQSLIFQELMKLFDKLFPFAFVVSLNVLSILYNKYHEY